MAVARRGVLPGFHLTLGTTLLYVALIVLVPMCALALKASALDWTQFRAAAFGERALAAYRVSFGASLLGGAIDTVLGLLVAWVLARYRFPGRAVLDALVDLPFALPTAVAGIALSTLYAPHGFFGRHFAAPVAFAYPGVVIALAFVGFPFVVRTVQPVLMELDPAVEEAAATLGASRFRTLTRVLLPAALPALATGFGLAFARALGEYGSIVFVSGNLPLRTEIAPVLIVAKLEQYDYAGATAIALVLLGGSFTVLLALNLWQHRQRRGQGAR
jgi:sulfate transport system permease protein